VIAVVLVVIPVTVAAGIVIAVATAEIVAAASNPFGLDQFAWCEASSSGDAF
jgi:hypothetical protein